MKGVRILREKRRGKDPGDIYVTPHGVFKLFDPPNLPRSDRTYESELKQIMTTNGEGYPTSSYLDNSLWMIKEAVDGLPEFVDIGLNPFENSGVKFKNDVFEIEAYSWDESYDQPYNFKFRDIEVSWYKYLGRGMRVNRDVSALECAEMAAKCINSLMNANGD